MSNETPSAADFLMETLVNFTIWSIRSTGLKHGPGGASIEETARRMIRERIAPPVMGNRGPDVEFTDADLKGLLDAIAEMHLRVSKGENWREQPGRY